MRLRRRRVVGWGAAVGGVLVLLILRASLYRVFPHEQVLVLQFGRIVGEPKVEPGLYFKNPFTQRIVRLEKRLLAWDGLPDRVPTRDKKNIFVDVYARWRIKDPRLFYTSVRTVEEGQKKLDDLVDGAVRDVISSHDLIEVVRSTSRPLLYGPDRQLEGLAPEKPVRIERGREKLEALIRQNVAPVLLKNYGMELVDVRIKRVNYVESVRREVYERMKSERQRIAARLLSEAQEYRQRILGETEKEVAIIEGEAEEQAARIRGEGEAQAIKIYAQALQKAPELFAFLRALEAYRKAIGPNTHLVLTTDGPFFQALNGIAPSPPPAPTTRPTPWVGPRTRPRRRVRR